MQPALHLGVPLLLHLAPDLLHVRVPLLPPWDVRRLLAVLREHQEVGLPLT